MLFQLLLSILRTERLLVVKGTQRMNRGQQILNRDAHPDPSLKQICQHIHLSSEPIRSKTTVNIKIMFSCTYIW